MKANPRSLFMLILFVLIVAAVAASGVQFRPGQWYEHLQKPIWTPPNWLFPPVWSVLYLMIALSGWMIFSASNPMLKALWIAQLVFNGLWSWLFFGMHLTSLGLADIVALFTTIFALLHLSRKTSPTVAWLTLPYLFWVGYAATLNAAIVLLNRG
jgi:benzodiazapine receptor